MPRLKVRYAQELRPKLQQDLGLSNINEVPRLTKIVLNAGLGEGTKEYKIIEEMAKDLAAITGQKPAIRRAVKDVSAFNVRAGNPIGLMVTLRNKRMYEFLDRFIFVTLPRVRDFRGVSAKSFDHRGNLTIGLKEHTVFAEINMEKVFRVKGLNVTFVTTAKTDAHARALLSAFGMPFSGTGS
ncbi:50S ribosomal protein L5 [bacterium]|nr:50S ribosomal protein L5 [bacterium]